MARGIASLLVWIFAVAALSPIEAAAEKKKRKAKTVWQHPLIRIKSSTKRAKAASRIEISVLVTNPNKKPLVFLALGVPAKAPHVPVFSVEYRSAGKWRGHWDHDAKVQPLKGIRDGELAPGATVQGKLLLPKDWKRVRVGFAWTMKNLKPPQLMSWSRETSRQELSGKGKNTPSQPKVQRPRIRVLSVSRHVNKNFRGTSVQIEIHNPHRSPLSYYGFKRLSFSPPIPAGTIRPFGSRYEIAHKGVTRVKDVMISCPVGGGRLELKPGAKAVYSVWAPVVDDWDSIRIGQRWITGESGRGGRTVWTKPLKRNPKSGKAKSN